MNTGDVVRPSMSSANRRLVMARPAMLTVPSFSSSTTDIFLTGNMLKSAGDNMHHWRIPTVARNLSPIFPLLKTALVDGSYRRCITRIKLLPMFYYLMIAAHRTACHTLSKAFSKSMNI